MSSIISMPPAAASKSKDTPRSLRLNHELWRAVESQHLISTLRLVANDPAAQAILEDIIEEAKPPVPDAARKLHWLLATPFRYRPPPGGSRFRAWIDPGVFYAAIEQRTACAEAGYWKWRFVFDSAGLTKLDAHPMTLFKAHVHGRTWDLTRPPLSQRRTEWTQSSDYSRTQALAMQARVAGIQVLIYESVRDPQKASCVAVLEPAALRNSDPLKNSQSWFLTVHEQGALWVRDSGQLFQFDWQSSPTPAPAPDKAVLSARRDD